MICVIVNIYKDCKDLLPHFYKHYSSLGVDRFYVGIYGANTHWEWIKKISNDYDVIMIKTGDNEFDDNIDQDFINNTQKSLNKDDWYIPADLDEFHVFPGYSSFSDVIKDCKQTNSDYAITKFADHITSDGTIPSSIDPNISIWEQFPISTRKISIRLVKTFFIKVALAKQDVKILRGHHMVENKQWKQFDEIGKTHHFKWFGNLRERETNKLLIRIYKNETYLCEPARILEHLNLHNNKININDL